MAKLQLKYFPEDVLRQKAKKITTFDSSLRKLANEMLETMYAHNGVGLAAPQVGVSKRVMVIDVSDPDEGRSPIVFINPQLIEADGDMVGIEGCLSFPDVYFEVRRFARVLVKYQNLAGKDVKIEAADNLLCRAIQHEMDHLDGKLYIDQAVSKLEADLELSKHGFSSVAHEGPKQKAGETHADPQEPVLLG